MTLPLYWEDQETIAQLTALLQQHQVCLGTSDTVLGLLAPATLSGAQALDQIKQRAEKPYIILVDSQAKLAQLVDCHWPANLLNLINHSWPGPLTLIFKLQPNLPPLFTSVGSARATLTSAETGALSAVSVNPPTVAVRIPDHPGLLNLLTHFDGLFSTSANLAGQPVPSKLDEVNPVLLAGVSAVVLDRTPRPARSNLPSTILDCSELSASGTGQIRVVRAGAYEVPVLEQIYGERFRFD